MASDHAESTKPTFKTIHNRTHLQYACVYLLRSNRAQTHNNTLRVRTVEFHDGGLDPGRRVLPMPQWIVESHRHCMFSFASRNGVCSQVNSMPCRNVWLRTTRAYFRCRYIMLWSRWHPRRHQQPLHFDHLSQVAADGRLLMPSHQITPDRCMLRHSDGTRGYY